MRGPSSFSICAVPWLSGRLRLLSRWSGPPKAALCLCVYGATARVRPTDVLCCVHARLRHLRRQPHRQNHARQTVQLPRLCVCQRLDVFRHATCPNKQARELCSGVRAAYLIGGHGVLGSVQHKEHTHTLSVSLPLARRQRHIGDYS